MGLWDALLYLVKWGLAGYSSRLAAAYMYFVENYSLTEISRELGVPRNSVAGYLGRLKLANGGGMRARHVGLRRLLELSYWVLKEIEPIYDCVGGVHVCRLCGRRVRSGVLGHLDREHRDVIVKAGRLAVRLLREHIAVSTAAGSGPSLTPSPHPQTWTHQPYPST